LFKTWNGARTLYIFDEDHNPIGLTTATGLPSKGATRSKRQSDLRKQMAKVSRKQNRRKR
jgi:hypothetical protein